MISRPFALYLALAVGFVCAQDNNKLEIRGIVVEAGLGVAGASITLFEFGHTPALATTRTVFATTSTDSQGVFTFHPERPGEYYVEAQKEGYFAESFDGPTADPVATIGDPVTIDQDHSKQERTFTLMRLGEVRGRVIDEDGLPIAKLRVVVRTPSSLALRNFENALTDQDGYFTASKLRPGNYVAAIPGRGPEILPQFSTSDLEIVDQDLEGADDRFAPALPVSGGAVLSVGIITARRRPYYRAHVSVQADDCAPGETWIFSPTPLNPGYGSRVPCGKDFLVRNLSPGSYSFRFSATGRSGVTRWAVAPVEITDRNVEIALTMSAGAEIHGRIVADDGAAAPPLDIVIHLSFVTVVGSQSTAPNPEGKFTIRGIPGQLQQVYVAGLRGKFYVKEIRYNGLRADGGIILPGDGPMDLEILIDDKAASVTGVVFEGDKAVRGAVVLIVKWPPPPGGSEIAPVQPTDGQGKFRVDGLAPGAYRILAVTNDVMAKYRLPGIEHLVDRAEKVTLERGASQSISLRIVEP